MWCVTEDADLASNELLELYKLRWVETDLLKDCFKLRIQDCKSTWQDTTGARSSDNKPQKGNCSQPFATMKPPSLCTPLLSKWRDSIRVCTCYKYAFAVPNERALQVIAYYSPVVEVGAGTGYWAGLLRKRGVEVIAVDIAPPATSHN